MSIEDVRVSVMNNNVVEDLVISVMSFRGGGTWVAALLELNLTYLCWLSSPDRGRGRA